MWGLKAFFVVFDIFNSLELSFVFLSYLISMLKIASLKRLTPSVACLPYLPMHRLRLVPLGTYRN